MATEVELKAWIDNPDRVRTFLTEHATPSGSFLKEDTYFCKKGEERTLFRLRRQDGSAVVTYKERSRQGGTEINREYEFTVSDPDNFIHFVDGIGFYPCIDKCKEGELFILEGANVELSHVLDLGWFVEIEALVEHENEDAGDRERYSRDIEEANTKIRSILSRTGISTDRIEDRYYIELLRSKRKEQ